MQEILSDVLTLINDAMSFTKYTNIINFILEKELYNDFVKILNNYAENSNSEKIVLIGTNDKYVRLIVENQDRLNKKYVFNYPKLDIINNVLMKDKFYNEYKDLLDIPKTYIHPCGEGKEVKDEFNYPIVLKPGNGVEYYKHEFSGMSKVYKINNYVELLEVIEKIDASGYKDSLIIQEFIPGDDSCLHDVMMYCGKDKKVKLITFAQIGLQERTNTGVGNCTLLVNGYTEYYYPEELLMNLKKFMEEIGFQGFAEFDLKYDIRDNKYKIFEINPRQSRSGYYLTACGHNLVKYLIDDLVKNEKINFTLLKEKMVLSFVPKKVIFKYVDSIPLKKEIKSLIKKGKMARPLNYKADKNIKRKIYLFLRDLNYIKKYKNLKW